MLSLSTNFTQIEQGITLLTTESLSCQDITSKIMINSGCKRLDSATEIAANYIPNSFVPKQDWRFLNSIESNLLTARKYQWNTGLSIGLIKIPKDVVDPLKQTLGVNGSDLSTHRLADCLILDENNYQKGVDKIIDYISIYTKGNDKAVTPLGVKISFPGLITATQDYNINYFVERPYIGIHLDHWEEDPLKRRQVSRNRLCINLGEETRYFLFVNLSILQIFNMLGFKDPDDIPMHYRGFALPALFLEKYPNYPICKLSLNPNEAYIAPTENMLHDATSLGKTLPDISMNFLGRFSL